MFRIPNKADATYARQAGGFSADVDTIAAALAGDGVLSGLGVAAHFSLLGAMLVLALAGAPWAAAAALRIGVE